MMQNFAPENIDLSKLRVAIVHYWFVGRAGGEKVVEALAELFPKRTCFLWWQTGRHWRRFSGKGP